MTTNTTVVMNNNMLSNYFTIMCFNEVCGNTLFIKTLYEFSKTEWLKLVDIDTGNHLVSGKIVSNVKTTAINTYVCKLVKLYLNSSGPLCNNWTKEHLCIDGIFSKAFLNRVSTLDINDNKTLFTMVLGNLVGYDKLFIEAAIGDLTDEKVIVDLLTFVALRNDHVQYIEDGRVMMKELATKLSKINYIGNRSIIVTEVLERLNELPLYSDTSVYTLLAESVDMFYSGE